MTAQKEIILSTESIDLTERYDFWREVNRLFYEVTPLTPGDNQEISGAIQAKQIGRLAYATTKFSAQKFTRHRGIVVQSNLDCYQLQYLVEGSLNFDSDGMSLNCRQGDICLFDLAKPYINRASAGGRINVILPREIVEGRVGSMSMHGVVVRKHDPMGAMLRGLVTEMQMISGRVSSTDATAIEDAIATILSAIRSRNHATRPNAGSATHSWVLRRRAAEFIQANLASISLDVDYLVNSLRVSRSHIYRAFEADGGIATYIRNARLDMAYRNLAAPGMQRKSISEVAYECGFSSASHFSRAFRKRFGVAPKDTDAITIQTDSSYDFAARMQAHLLRQTIR